MTSASVCGAQPVPMDGVGGSERPSRSLHCTHRWRRCRSTVTSYHARMPTKVLLAEPRGFCAGVEMAIKALTWMVRIFEPPVYCYHEIVHNAAVVAAFERAGVVFVDSVEDVHEGRPVMPVSYT